MSHGLHQPLKEISGHPSNGDNNEEVHTAGRGGSKEDIFKQAEEGCILIGC